MGCDCISASGEDAWQGMIYKALLVDMIIIHETLLLESRASTRMMLANDIVSAPRTNN